MISTMLGRLALERLPVPAWPGVAKGARPAAAMALMARLTNWRREKPSVDDSVSGNESEGIRYSAEGLNVGSFSMLKLFGKSFSHFSRRKRPAKLAKKVWKYFCVSSAAERAAPALTGLRARRAPVFPSTARRGTSATTGRRSRDRGEIQAKRLTIASVRLALFRASHRRAAGGQPQLLPNRAATAPQARQGACQQRGGAAGTNNLESPARRRS